LSAAAAVAVVAAVGAAVATIGSRTGGESDDAETSAATQDESVADDGAATSEEADEGAGSGNDAATSGPPAADSGGEGAALLPTDELGDLGAFASATDLVDRVRDDRTRFDADATTGQAETDGEAQRTAERALADGGISCEPLPDALATPGMVVRSSGTASLDGDRVSVLVAVDPTGDLRVVVVDSGCAVRADEPL
jgi:hypothetical protein